MVTFILNINLRSVGRRLDQVEETVNQPSFPKGGEYFSTHAIIEPSHDGSSPRILRLPKRNNRTKSTPFDKEDNLDLPKLSSQLDLSPQMDSQFYDNRGLEHSNASEYNRSPHIVFQNKRNGIPSLNLHGSIGSIIGKDSRVSSPLKIENVPKKLFESDFDQNYEKYSSVGQSKHIDENPSRTEHVSMLDMNEDRSVM